MQEHGLAGSPHPDHRHGLAAQAHGTELPARATPAAPGGTVFGEDGREAFRNAMEHCEVTLHGRRISYRSTGSGPLLVLIHGMAGTSATRLCTRLRVGPASPPSRAGTGA
jgi:hypothetical protein